MVSMSMTSNASNSICFVLAHYAVLAEKIKINDTVQFTIESIFLGIVKNFLKTIFEFIRESSLSLFGFQQLEVDMYFLRSIFPVLLTLLFCMCSFVYIFLEQAVL